MSTEATETLVATSYEVLEANGRSTVHHIKWPAKPGLELIRKCLHRPLSGSHFERVNVWYYESYLDMFVDEEGMLKRLPVNDRATAIYRANAIAHIPNAIPGLLPKIFGTAVLFHRRVWF